MQSVPRKLNDYESMLATSTVNSALRVRVDCSADELVAHLRAAWQHTVDSYVFLRCEIRPREGDKGALGQRYDLLCAEGNEERGDALHITRGTCPAGEALVRALQDAGTNRLLLRSTYHASCIVCAVEAEEAEQAEASVVVALNHAVCDGRGALHLAHALMEHLAACVDGESGGAIDPVPAYDLQKELLGPLYAGDAAADVGAYPELDDIRSALKGDRLVDGAKLLPPEPLQGIPLGEHEQDEASTIECVMASLDADSTARLRTRLSAAGASVQGALSAAWAATRAALLGLQGPLAAAFLTPADARQHAPAVPLTAPLCGSAGLWHTLRLEGGLLACAAECTRGARGAAARGQHLEWLRCLFHAPASLPPHSLIASSVGVAPVLEEYAGGRLRVSECIFFGGAMRGAAHHPPGRQGTMAHAVTFGGRLQVMCNYTAPGVPRPFALATARVLRAALLAMADAPLSGDVAVADVVRLHVPS